MYEKVPEEQHIFGFMFLEGLGVPRDYQKAMYYFDNSTNPLFNSTFCVFGKGILHFYGFFHCSGLFPGLGVPKNESLGCQYIDQAFHNNLGKAIFAYYAGICKLRDHCFMEANDDLTAGAFSQFTPAIDAVLRMKELNLGQRLRVNSDAFFASVLLGKTRDFFLPITDVSLSPSSPIANPRLQRPSRHRLRASFRTGWLRHQYSLLGDASHGPLREARLARPSARARVSERRESERGVSRGNGGDSERESRQRARIGRGEGNDRGHARVCAGSRAGETGADGTEGSVLLGVGMGDDVRGSVLTYEEGDVETSKLYFDRASRRGEEVRGSCGE